MSLQASWDCGLPVTPGSVAYAIQPFVMPDGAGLGGVPPPTRMAAATASVTSSARSDTSRSARPGCQVALSQAGMRRVARTGTEDPTRVDGRVGMEKIAAVIRASTLAIPFGSGITARAARRVDSKRSADDVIEGPPAG